MVRPDLPDQSFGGVMETAAIVLATLAVLKLARYVWSIVWEWA
jgi:hypothetical protein